MFPCLGKIQLSIYKSFKLFDQSFIYAFHFTYLIKRSSFLYNFVVFLFKISISISLICCEEFLDNRQTNKIRKDEKILFGMFMQSNWFHFMSIKVLFFNFQSMSHNLEYQHISHYFDIYIYIFLRILNNSSLNFFFSFKWIIIRFSYKGITKRNRKIKLISFFQSAPLLKK